jgi:hypothetical protein
MYLIIKLFCFNTLPIQNLLLQKPLLSFPFTKVFKTDFNISFITFTFEMVPYIFLNYCIKCFPGQHKKYQSQDKILVFFIKMFCYKILFRKDRLLSKVLFPFKTVSEIHFKVSFIIFIRTISYTYLCINHSNALCFFSQFIQHFLYQVTN